LTGEIPIPKLGARFSRSIDTECILLVFTLDVSVFGVDKLLVPGVFLGPKTNVSFTSVIQIQNQTCVLGLEIAIRCEGKFGEVGIRFVAKHKHRTFVRASIFDLKVLARLLMLDVELLLRV